jgi:hypothetical protein
MIYSSISTSSALRNVTYASTPGIRSTNKKPRGAVVIQLNFWCPLLWELDKEADSRDFQVRFMVLCVFYCAHLQRKKKLILYYNKCL